MPNRWPLHYRDPLPVGHLHRGARHPVVAAPLIDPCGHRRHTPHRFTARRMEPVTLAATDPGPRSHRARLHAALTVRRQTEACAWAAPVTPQPRACTPRADTRSAPLFGSSSHHKSQCRPGDASSSDTLSPARAPRRHQARNAAQTLGQTPLALGAGSAAHCRPVPYPLCGGQQYSVDVSGATAA